MSVTIKLYPQLREEKDLMLPSLARIYQLLVSRWMWLMYAHLMEILHALSKCLAQQ